MKKKYRLLSYPINSDTPIYGNGRPLVVDRERSIEKGDSCNLFYVSFNNHFGTHVDAPKHFSEGGRSITDYEISELIFDAPALVECEKAADELIMPDDIIKHESRVKSADILLLRTGFYKIRGQKVYSLHNPGVSPETFKYLRENCPNLRAIMIDTISVSAFQRREDGRKAHFEALSAKEGHGQPLLLVEDADLSGDFGGLSQVMVVPLFLKGVDSMPCTVIGIFY